jgi:5'-3' exoribonuclease 1
VAEATENVKFTQVVLSRAGPSYYPAYQIASMLGINGLAVAKITSSFMALLVDGSKVNLGLSLKFDAKSLKVLNWSRKERGWEFSAQALELIREYKVWLTGSRTS